jgi:hypothetical protein
MTWLYFVPVQSVFVFVGRPSHAMVRALRSRAAGGEPTKVLRAEPLVGRCTLTPPDPQLKGGWFQPLTLEHQSWFQNVPFKFNLRRYTLERLEMPHRRSALTVHRQG